MVTKVGSTYKKAQVFAQTATEKQEALWNSINVEQFLCHCMLP